MSLFRICGTTDKYAMNPESTAEIIQLAGIKTMIDQTQHPPFPRQTYLPYFDTLQPIKPFTITAFSTPEARDHPHQNNKFMSLENAYQVFGKNKQLLVNRDGSHATSDVFRSRLIQGPDGSNYTSGTFVMFLNMTDNFPKKTPQARFITPIIHPNINKFASVNQKDWALRIAPDLNAIPSTKPMKSKLANFHTPSPSTAQGGSTSNQ
ncbi:hypothetical protein TWF970_008443 [Orbilia oligospora]|uniref:UBC core domain-containing protein n=1 Tax=Orbilia oligospora TaxID=2813651 RepID=A0A7C8RME4_ORBOL|nr:hypothetical protein TWF970_008443 [Orbilia oligospora]